MSVKIVELEQKPKYRFFFGFNSFTEDYRAIKIPTVNFPINCSKAQLAKHLDVKDSSWNFEEAWTHIDYNGVYRYHGYEPFPPKEVEEKGPECDALIERLKAELAVEMKALDAAKAALDKFDMELGPDVNDVVKKCLADGQRDAKSNHCKWLVQVAKSKAHLEKVINSVFKEPQWCLIKRVTSRPGEGAATNIDYYIQRLWSPMVHNYSKEDQGETYTYVHAALIETRPQ
jgi:hypothetical protein